MVATKVRLFHRGYVTELSDNNSVKKKLQGREGEPFLKYRQRMFADHVFSAEKTEVFQRPGIWRFGGGPRTVGWKTIVSVPGTHTRKSDGRRLWFCAIL